MEEESANKRRRLERAPPKTPSNPDLAAASMDALPDAVLQHCFAFIGKGHYLYVAGASRRFNEIYSIKHEKKTTMKSVVASVSCADLFLQDVREQYEESTNDTLQIIFLNAALIGNVKVLKWARDKGHEPKARDFKFAAIHGHAAVLQWAEENSYDWCSDELINIAVANGTIIILEWIQNRGNAIPAGGPAQCAAAFGQCAVLSWMKERDLLGSIQDLWSAACLHGGHIDVLDWLFNNGYSVDPDLILCIIVKDCRNALLWLRDHGFFWDVNTCVLAVLRNNLPLLQWLRENDCPWDRTVVAAARHVGREDIEQWAIDNGCPTEEEI